MTQQNEQDKDTKPTVKSTEAKIWLTPDVVQRIIEADEIFEDIEDELQKETTAT